MAIFAISDLHLAFDENKPMDIFGVNWENHFNKIEQDWMKKVTDGDLVILAGDFSWGLKLEETKKDFEFLDLLLINPRLSKDIFFYFFCMNLHTL